MDWWQKYIFPVKTAGSDWIKLFGVEGVLLLCFGELR